MLTAAHISGWVPSLALEPGPAAGSGSESIGPGPLAGQPGWKRERPVNVLQSLLEWLF